MAFVTAAAYRVRQPAASSVTRRKQLAQEIRNELAAYKRRASDEAPEFVQARDRVMFRIDAKMAELLSLEGFER